MKVYWRGAPSGARLRSNSPPLSAKTPQLNTLITSDNVTIAVAKAQALRRCQVLIKPAHNSFRELAPIPSLNARISFRQAQRLRRELKSVCQMRTARNSFG